MHLTEAVVDIETGNPVVAGQIILHLGDRPPITVPPHSHILLDFPRRPYSKVVCRAVTGMRRLANGFYALTKAEPHFYLPFQRDTFGSELSSYSDGRVAFKSSCCGGFYRAKEYFYSVDECALARRFEDDGMAFGVTGTFGGTGGPQSNDPPSAHAHFEIRGLLRWETLRLYGFSGGYLRSLLISRPTKSDHDLVKSQDSADPVALGDLLLGPEGPLVAGNLRLIGVPSRATPETSRIVHFQCDAAGLALASCHRVERGTDGFCNRLEKGEIRFNSTPITLPWIEHLLREENCTTVTLAGKEVGEVIYETGSLLGVGVPETIRLRAERLDVDISLSKAGLELKIAAAMGKTGRRSVSARAFVPEPNDGSQFLASATLPWSHLLVLGSVLADRRVDFS